MSPASPPVNNEIPAAPQAIITAPKAHNSHTPPGSGTSTTATHAPIPAAGNEAAWTRAVLKEFLMAAAAIPAAAAARTTPHPRAEIRPEDPLPDPPPITRRHPGGIGKLPQYPARISRATSAGASTTQLIRRTYSRCSRTIAEETSTSRSSTTSLSATAAPPDRVPQVPACHQRFPPLSPEPVVHPGPSPTRATRPHGRETPAPLSGRSARPESGDPQRGAARAPALQLRVRRADPRHAPAGPPPGISGTLRPQGP